MGGLEYKDPGIIQMWIKNLLLSHYMDTLGKIKCSHD